MPTPKSVQRIGKCLLSRNKTKDYLIRRVLLFCNTYGTRVDSVVRLVLRKWPQCKILLVIKRQHGDSLPPMPLRCHVVYRDNPMPFCKGVAIIRRFGRMRFDVLSVFKQELTLKILLGMFLLRPRKFLMVQGSAENIAVRRMTLRDLMKWILQKRQTFSSIVISIIPLIVLLCQLPMVLVRLSPWQNKKNLINLIFHNILHGPLADSTWLFLWLQVAMAHAFIWAGKQSKTPQRICVLRIDHVGDNVNTIPLVRALRKDFPASHIAVLCDSGEFIWRNCPYVDEVLIYKTNNRLINRSGGRAAWMFRPFTFYRQLQKRRFDLVIDPVGRTESHIISYLCTAARRISNTYYPYELYDIEIPLRHYQTFTHETVRALALWQPEATITEDDTRLEAWLTDAERSEAESIFAAAGITGDKRCIGIHPGAVSRLRLWPIERFARVAHALCTKHSTQVVYFEPPGMEAMTATFVQELASMGSSAAIVHAASLRSLMALLAKCDLLVCLDSGPMHLVAAVNIPTVAIFGPGEYWRWQPRHNGSRIVRQPLDCAPCSQDTCCTPECMLKVHEEEVLAACELVLAQRLPCRP